MVALANACKGPGLSHVREQFAVRVLRLRHKLFSLLPIFEVTCSSCCRVLVRTGSAYGPILGPQEP